MSKIKIDAFDTYGIYNAIKLTYDDSSSYDWFKYGGGIKKNKETFLKRKDKNHSGNIERSTAGHIPRKRTGSLWED